MLFVVFGFILFDILTGVLQGFYEGKINSTKMRQGLFHKASELLSVIGGYLAEYAMVYVKLDISLPVADVVGGYVCILEAISIIENLSSVNPAMGAFFSKYLEKLKKKESENE